MSARRRIAMPYRHALQWMLDNDDVEFLTDLEAPGSVTAALVADIYKRSDDEVSGDLLALRERGAP